MTEPTQPAQASWSSTLPEKIKKKLKGGWWLGVLFGLVCHFVPPDYQDACRTLIRACTP